MHYDCVQKPGKALHYHEDCCYDPRNVEAKQHSRNEAHRPQNARINTPSPEARAEGRIPLRERECSPPVVSPHEHGHQECDSQSRELLKNYGVHTFSAQRKAHWPGAAASDVAMGTKLNRLLPVQWSEKLAASHLDSQTCPQWKAIDVRRRLQVIGFWAPRGEQHRDAALRGVFAILAIKLN